MNLKRWTAGMLAVLAVGAALPSALAEKSYVSIRQLREDNATGWHETYEAYGRTIKVDVAVEVPDAAACPVLRVSQGPVPDAELVANYQNTAPSAASVGLFWGQMGPEEKGVRNSNYRVYDVKLGETVPQAEENPMTYEEACRVIDQELYRLSGLRLAEDYVIRQVQVFSRVYRYQIKKGEVVWGEPVDDMGQYDVQALQVLHGIPLLEGPYYSTYARGPAITVAGRASFGIRDAERFILVYQYAIEQGIAQADVPLLPFDAVKKQLEALISDGLIRQVWRVELGYVSFFDPEDKSCNYTLPAWCVRAVVADKASRELKEPTYDALGRLEESLPWKDMYFLAQTGEFLDCESRASNRRDVRKIITWDQVK